MIRIGIGSHVSGSIHATAYTANNGEWGGIVVKTEVHPCSRISCIVQTELLGVALAIQQLKELPAHFTFATCNERTTHILKGIQRSRTVPHFCEGPLGTLVRKQFTRIAEGTWAAVTSNSPGAEARKMAQDLHHQIVSAGRKTLPLGVVNELAGFATKAFAR